jgi:hypothetical protein
MRHRVVQAVLVGQERVEQAAELDERTPVAAGAGRPAQLDPRNDPDVVEADLGQEPPVPGPPRNGPATAPLVLLDHDHPVRRLAQVGSATPELVLQAGRLAVLMDPRRAGLAEEAAWAGLERERERERADAAADVSERGDGDLPGAVAQVEAIEPEPGGDHCVGDAELAIELEGPGLVGHDAGRLPGAGVLVERAERHPGPRQPQGEDRPGRAGPEDQDPRSAHGLCPWGRGEESGGDCRRTRGRRQRRSDWV